MAADQNIPPRIFVAGATGQVALSLQKAAAARGLMLACHGRPAFDLLDAEAVKAAILAFEPSVIVNAAAYTAVDAAEADEAGASAVNEHGAALLAQVAATLDIPFIHLSTDYVFDGTKSGAYVETDATGPTGAYGRSKLAGEQAVLAAHTKAIILRTAWVYSPFGKNFLKTMLKLAESRDSLPVVADQVGNPTYAPDIVGAVLAIVDRLHTSGWRPDYAGLFHLAGQGDTSWHGFAEAIFEAAARYGRKCPVITAISSHEFPTPAKRPANSRLDCSKLSDTFGITLPPWQESTSACIARLFDSQ